MPFTEEHVRLTEIKRLPQRGSYRSRAGSVCTQGPAHSSGQREKQVMSKDLSGEGGRKGGREC